MAKGGARAHSGPAPDPLALRRDRDAGEWTVLPAAGRSGPAPVWPFELLSEREETLWQAEWARPQAVMWERNGQELEVALYVRSLVEAEARDASVAARTLVRQQQEALGLSLPGLHRNKWTIEAVEADRPAPAKRTSAKSRLKVVRDPAGD